MKIINEREEKKRETEFFDNIYNFFKENWKGRVAYAREDWEDKIKLYKNRWTPFSIAKIEVDYGSKELNATVKGEGSAYNKLKNVLKLFENTHKKIKIELKIT